MAKPERNKKVVAAYRDEGLSLTKCASRFGISKQRVHQILIAAGVPINNPVSLDTRLRIRRAAQIGAVKRKMKRNAD
jgi:predicted DNA-binding protein YlxM (UPF0122 family)